MYIKELFINNKTNYVYYKYNEIVRAYYQY